MGKNNRHQKNLKSEKAKVKLKAKKKTNNLPKGLNVTDTSFKVKKIVIREQLKQHEETEILSRRKLNVKELLSRLEHHNLNVRQEAIRELKEMLVQHSREILSSQLHSLLQGIAGLILDKEKDVRRDALKVLNLILGPISNEQLRPFWDVLISYLRCSMTHIDPNIKEDSLSFLDVLALNCGSLLAKNARRVLPNFLDMISKLRSESSPGRQLVTTLSSKNSSVKWRTKVLGRLSTILRSVVNERRLRTTENSDMNEKTIVVSKEEKVNVSIYNSNLLKVCKIDLNGKLNLSDKEESELEELMKYSQVLMPLVFDSWLEVMPKQNSVVNCDSRVITHEAATLLKSISEVVLFIVEYFEVLETESDFRDQGTWFRDHFLSGLEKHLLDKFPYCQTKNVIKSRKRQDDFEMAEWSEKCHEQNFSLCYAYLWILTADGHKKIENAVSKQICIRILDYVNEALKNWSRNEVCSLSLLAKLLRVIFFRGSKIFYKSGINLDECLSSMTQAYSRGSKREFQLLLLTIISEIALDHDMKELHNADSFKSFIILLPDVLLQDSIHQNTIEMLNRIVLHHGIWIREQLVNKRNEIIENAKKIEIVGSEDEKQSRLMIWNLFYFVDGEIYY